MKHHFYTYLIAFFLLVLSCESNQQVELLAYSSSECVDGIDYNNLKKIQNRILESTITDDVHLYKLFVVANCSQTTAGKVEISNDTLYLAHHGQRDYREYKVRENDSIIVTHQEWTEPLADCDCAFTLSYKIRGLENKNYTILLQDKPITKTQHKFKIVREAPRFSVVNGDTINMIDIYGLKQGLHVNLHNGRMYARIVYKDDLPYSGLAKTYYDFNGYGKVETFMAQGKYTKRKYYNTKGKLIKICDTDGSFDEGTNCELAK